MRKPCPTIVALICLFVVVSCFGFTGTALAQYGDDIMISVESNSGWILSKKTRKLMFFRYVEPNEVWKSNTTTLPANIDLDNSTFDCVGSRGNAVFLFDRTSGIIHFFLALKDHSILQYVDINAKSYVQ